MEKNYTPIKESTEKSSKSGSEHEGLLVKILHYDPQHHRYKIVNAENNQPVRSSRMTHRDIEQNNEAFDYRTAKTLKTEPGPEGPIVEVNNEEAFIQGSSQHGFFSGGSYGNIIKGELSIEAQPHAIRLSGMSILNPLITSGFPSTLATPLPTTVLSIPGAATVASMSKDIAVMAALVGLGGLA